MIRLLAETLAKIESLTAEITDLEAELKKEREQERLTGKKSSEGAALGLGDDEDWTVNERGEVGRAFSSLATQLADTDPSLSRHRQVINEDGLPIFDIREDLPPEPEPTPTAAPLSSSSSGGTAQKPMRYLVKKGGKQVIRKS